MELNLLIYFINYYNKVYINTLPIHRYYSILIYK